MFENRTLFIATKHKKEEVIRPIFESSIGVKCIVPENFDTDLLGTFSGDIERSLSPVDAAREKCFLIVNNYGGELVVASEGSFFPHPVVGFFPINEEILLFLDIKTT